MLPGAPAVGEQRAAPPASSRSRPASADASAASPPPSAAAGPPGRELPRAPSALLPRSSPAWEPGPAPGAGQLGAQEGFRCGEGGGPAQDWGRSPGRHDPGRGHGDHLLGGFPDLGASFPDRRQLRGRASHSRTESAQRVGFGGGRGDPAVAPAGPCAGAPTAREAAALKSGLLAQQAGRGAQQTGFPALRPSAQSALPGLCLCLRISLSLMARRIPCSASPRCLRLLFGTPPLPCNKD